MKDIDKNLDSDSGDTVRLGEKGPMNIPLVNARTGEGTSLGSSAPDNKSLVLVMLRHFA